MSETSTEKFTFVTTEDGSPSLRFRIAADAESESMHSLRGAFSETVYIYGTALDRMVQEAWPPSILSLGLGLGYNEVLATAALFDQPGETEFHLESFEIDQDLRDYFRAWAYGEKLSPEFQTVYDEILKRCADLKSLEPQALKTRVAEHLRTNRLRLREELTPTTEFETRFSCFLFDAFSSKSTPELWSEEFLKDFLSKTALSSAVFSTYACTGALKRSLREAGFDLQIRQGFASKRDCTFAVSGREPKGQET